METLGPVELLVTTTADLGPHYPAEPVTAHFLLRADGTMDVHLDDKQERNIACFTLTVREVSMLSLVIA